MKHILLRKINSLNIDVHITDLLEKNNVKYIYELCSLNRKSLKEYGLTQECIKQIIVKLQLLGLDLNKKYKI